MRTNELSGAALDWAVAECEVMHVDVSRGGWLVFDSDAFSEFRNDYNDDKLQRFSPSTNWAQGGPIIEREGLAISRVSQDEWSASLIYEDKTCGGLMYTNQHGTTPLVAAMRCYVASKLGDEVELPEGVK